MVQLLGAVWCHHETITVSLLLALLLATLYFYLDSLKLSSKGLLAFVAVVNPLTVQLVAANRIVVMEKICLLIYFAWEERTCSRPQNNLQSSSNQVLRLTDSSEPPLQWLRGVILLVAFLLNPQNIVYAICICNLRHFSLLTAVSLALILVVWVSPGLLVSLYSYYDWVYFPTTFSSQTNLLWILYAHMFENYISLYQLFFNIIPVLGSAVLVFIRIPERLKLVVASFLATYCSYLCPLPSVLAFFLFCCLLIEPAHNLISEASAKSDYKKVVLIKLLSTIFAIVSAVFLLLNTILLRKYSSGWAINIGHVFLFASIMWGFIALYLVQLINCYAPDTLGETESPTLMLRLRKYLADRIDSL